MALLQSLQVNDFRGVASCMLNGFGDVNVVIGRNNTGKSSLLEAMTLSFAFSEPIPDVLGKAVQEVWSNARAEHQWPAGLVRAGAKACRVIVHGMPGGSAWGAALRGDRLELDGSNARRMTYPFGFFFPQHATNRDIERTLWPRLLSTRIDRDLAAQASKIFDAEVESLQILPDGALIVATPTTGIRLDAQGSGFRAALRLLMVAGAARGGVLVVEEPECHQHPSSLKRLAKALTDECLSHGTQLFVTTHSLECVRAFAEAAPASSDPTKAPAFITWGLAKSREGVVTGKRLTRETVLGLDEAGTDVRFMDEYQ